MSAASGRLKRAISSFLGFTCGVLLSTFVISIGSKVLAFGMPTTTGSVYVMVTQTLSTTSGNVVSGAVSVLGYATPDLDVAGIQFQINGVNLGGEVTSGACSIGWDTTGGPDGSYSVTAIVRDTSSNYITSTPVTVLVENAPPQISAVSATNISTSAATINWTTNQPSSTQVFYGPGGYTTSTAPNFTTTTSHSQALTGLTPHTTYHYRVESRNAAGVVASSSDLVFTTASPSAPFMSVDTPSNGATSTLPLKLAGWALDQDATSGTGVDAVHVWAFPTSGGAPIFVGAATYGISRPDVGAVFGPNFSNCGFRIFVQQLPPGTYNFTAYARSSVAGIFNNWRATTATISGALQVNISSFANGDVGPSAFLVGGSAFDVSSLTGTGVDAVHVWALPSGGSPIFLGAATLGIASPTVATTSGPQFANAGFRLTGDLPDGTYTIVAYARRTSTGQFEANSMKSFTVSGRGVLAMRVESVSFSGGTTNVQGWALDGRSLTGSGVDVIHVWAFGLWGGPGIFLGAIPTNTGSDRLDVASTYGTRFHTAGFGGALTGGNSLTLGTYNLVFFARSTATGKFDQSATIRVTR